MLGLFVAALLLVGAVQAGVYKCRGPDGVVTFSDRPCPGTESETVDVEVRNTMEGPPTSGGNADQIRRGIEAIRNLRAAQMGVDRATLDELEQVRRGALANVTITEWTNKPSATGKYLVVQGSVVNEGTEAVKFAKVVIRGLGDYGKLVDMETTYVRPSVLYPGERGTFQAWLDRPGVRKVTVRLTR